MKSDSDGGETETERDSNETKTTREPVHYKKNRNRDRGREAANKRKGTATGDGPENSDAQQRQNTGKRSSTGAATRNGDGPLSGTPLPHQPRLSSPRPAAAQAVTTVKAALQCVVCEDGERSLGTERRRENETVSLFSLLSSSPRFSSSFTFSLCVALVSIRHPSASLPFSRLHSRTHCRRPGCA